MARTTTEKQSFNVVVVAQHGRLSYEALIFVASLRAMSPDFSGRILVAEPQAGPLWTKDPSIRNQPVQDALVEMGAEIIPFQSTHFGEAYPFGNKIEMLQALPKGEPFVFFDTDTLITGDLANIRLGPGTSHSVTFQLAKGDTCRLLSKLEKWLEIQTNDGRKGWVAAFLT